jgi:hypothetical protein
MVRHLKRSRAKKPLQVDQRNQVLMEILTPLRNPILPTCVTVVNGEAARVSRTFE